MIILHFHLQTQFKNELFNILHIIVDVTIVEFGKGGSQMVGRYEVFVH